LIYLQHFIRVIYLVQKGRDYQRHSYKGSIPKERTTLFHLCQRGKESHIDVIEMTIDVEQCLVYMFPSMIRVDINVGIAINVKGGDCWIMLSLMPKV
jgi:hypothetical protein